MDIEALNTFLTLANTKNYTRTAAQLFVAQSTVTNRIHELEKELNIALFTRNNRSVELTVEGEQFKDYAEKVITLTNASLSEISSLHKYANHLRIGCSDSIYEGHLAPIILEHQRQFPNDALKITIGLSNLLMEQLQLHRQKSTLTNCKNTLFNRVRRTFDMLEVDKKTFEDEVLKAEGYVFVDFFGDGCVPCQALMPFVHEMADKYGDKIKFTSLNTTKARRLAIGQKILGLPVMAIYKDGEKVEEVVKDDATQESIEAMIKKYI